MLYISSRNKTDSFTAHKTLCSDFAPDGGLFLPYHLPLIDKQALLKMCEDSFAENIARILNMFFSVKLTAWDVECCVGRTPIKIQQMNRRIVTAECFHNPRNAYSYLEESLYRRLMPEAVDGVTMWPRIAIRIALLFAVYATLPVETRESFDVAVPTGDFSIPMAALYARKMGLPIRVIICCCNENGAVWDLIQRGDYNTGLPVVNTGMPDMDISCPLQVESLIFHTLGAEKTLDYNETVSRKGVFHLDEESFKQLSTDMASAVIGRDRIAATIRSVYRTNQYFISPLTAILYGGLQDYRSRSGESRYTLILADEAPALHVDKICEACGITRSEFQAIKE